MLSNPKRSDQQTTPPPILLFLFLQVVSSQASSWSASPQDSRHLWPVFMSPRRVFPLLSHRRDKCHCFRLILWFWTGCPTSYNFELVVLQVIVKVAGAGNKGIVTSVFNCQLTSGLLFINMVYIIFEMFSTMVNQHGLDFENLYKMLLTWIIFWKWLHKQ